MHVVRRHRKPILLVTLIGAVILLGGLFAARNTYLVQNLILHSDQNTVLEDPNQLRVRFWQESVLAITLEPEGSGPGTAGLASIKNDKQGTVLNENYYLQIGEEVGVVGLLLFLAILFIVAHRLYWRRDSEIAVALLASFIGLAFTNFLVHIWSNEAVAYTWWGLAGILLADRHSKIKIRVKKGKK
jgi:O-antigen ligase